MKRLSLLLNRRQTMLVKNHQSVKENHITDNKRLDSGALAPPPAVQSVVRCGFLFCDHQTKRGHSPINRKGVRVCEIFS